MEVVSEGAEAHERDYVAKRREYLAFGLREYWIIDPIDRRITVLVRDGDVWIERVSSATRSPRASSCPASAWRSRRALGPSRGVTGPAVGRSPSRLDFSARSRILSRPGLGPRHARGWKALKERRMLTNRIMPWTALAVALTLAASTDARADFGAFSYTTTVEAGTNTAFAGTSTATQGGVAVTFTGVSASNLLAPTDMTFSNLAVDATNAAVGTTSIAVPTRTWSA